MSKRTSLASFCRTRALFMLPQILAAALLLGPATDVLRELFWIRTAAAVTRGTSLRGAKVIAPLQPLTTLLSANSVWKLRDEPEWFSSAVRAGNATMNSSVAGFLLAVPELPVSINMGSSGGAFAASPINASRLQEIGRLIDSNNDTLLSNEELREFACGLEERQRKQQTSTIMRHVDRDGSANVSLAEIQAAAPNATADARQHQANRFAAADADASGQLDLSEFHAYVHPEVDPRVFAVEKDHQFGMYDADLSGFIDSKEFLKQSHATNEADFDEQAASEDFELHDTDHDGQLSFEEFGRLLAGHDLLTDNIAKLMEAGDHDGDGHIHLDQELPSRLHHLMDCEFVEDFFMHKDAGVSKHEEL